MENLDLVVYTVIVVVSFMFFIARSLREFTFMSKNSYKDNSSSEPDSNRGGSTSKELYKKN